MPEMNTNVKKRPLAAWLLIFLMLILGIGGIVSGPMLFLAPDGHLMQWSTADLAGSPFPNYLIPGLILFIFIGVFPLVVSLGLMMPGWKGLNFLNSFKAYLWPWTGSLATGVILLIWIITETAMLGYISFLQPVMGAWGIVILLLTALPSIRKYYR
jgi:hypothetical protein